MTLLIVYEDQTPYNPIIYTGILGDTQLDCYDRGEVVEGVCRAFGRLQINHEHLVAVVDGLLYDHYYWLDEHYCFALKNADR